MDPLSALGLASNIAQFVEFTWGLLGSTVTIYRSASDSVPKNAVLEIIARDATQLSDNIIIMDDCPTNLKALATECKSVAGDLLVLLSKLRAKKSKSKWASFVLALKDCLSSGQAESFLQRLSWVQTQLNTHIQYTILSKHAALHTMLLTLDNNTTRLNMNVQTTLDSLQRRLGQATKEIKNQERERAFQKEIASRLDLCFSLMQKADEGDVYSAILSLAKTLGDPKEIADTLTNLQKQSVSRANGQAILDSLYFRMIPVRHEKIKFAHAETFTWILDACSFGFVDWLRHGQGTFWIQGKAGSGKSTMMKFLCSHPETMRHLRTWARDKTLVVARYFFWNSGTELQKSQEGLLRSLLFEILRQNPEMVETFFPVGNGPTRAQADETWDLERLVSVYQRLTQQAMPCKFCFFIGGLDEFEGQPSTLISLIESLSRNLNIKVCISSRPWTEFVGAYGSATRRTIKLEDLTKNDIKLYVLDHFNADRRFQLNSNDPKYLDLVDEIARRARGVFLWVFLVVRSLLEGLVYADRISDLRRRLDAFPEDLEGFFQKMLDSVPKIYRAQTSQAFKVALVPSHPLPVLIYSFLDDIEEDPTWALDCDAEIMTREEIDERHETMRRRLDGRTKGLLEIVESFPKSSISMMTDCATIRTHTVDFLHRTVKDFMQNSVDVDRILKHQLSSDIDVYFRLCNALLASIKLAPSLEEYASDSLAVREHLVKQYISDLVTFAQSAYVQSKSNPMLDESEIIYILEDTEVIVQHERFECYHLDGYPVVRAAVEKGFCKYVEMRLEAEAEIPRQSLLEHAFRSGSPIHPKVVQLLLQFGVAVNENLNGDTTWSRCLQSLAEYRNALIEISQFEEEARSTSMEKGDNIIPKPILEQPSEPERVEAINLLIQHGADLSFYLRDLHLEAREFLSKYFRVYQSQDGFFAIRTSRTSARQRNTA